MSYRAVVPYSYILSLHSFFFKDADTECVNFEDWLSETLYCVIDVEKIPQSTLCFRSKHDYLICILKYPDLPKTHTHLTPPHIVR